MDIFVYFKYFNVHYLKYFWIIGFLSLAFLLFVKLKEGRDFKIDSASSSKNLKKSKYIKQNNKIERL